MLSPEPASVHQTFCPTDATCQRLTALVLKLASVSDIQYVWLTETLQSFANEDASFAEWLSKNEILAPLNDNPSGAIAGNLVASKLLKCLCSLSFGDREDSAPAILWQTAQTCLRLRALESRFDATLQARQLEQLYNFAYGLSHELNNPLANISTRASLLAQSEPDAKKADLFASIVDNAMRGKELLGDLMLIARPPQLELVRMDICEFMDNLSDQASRWSKPHSIEISTRVECSCTILADHNSLLEVGWAVLRNAIEAMPQGGNISCETTCTESTVLITIEDNGPGLTDEALRYAFDPFYSGREAGRGLGIGLAKCQSIIKLHHGTITLANGAINGARVEIELPRVVD